jgi:hypothetical protein
MSAVTLSISTRGFGRPAQPPRALHRRRRPRVRQRDRRAPRRVGAAPPVQRHAQARRAAAHQHALAAPCVRLDGRARVPARRRGRRCSATRTSPRPCGTSTIGPVLMTRPGCRARSAASPCPQSCPGTAKSTATQRNSAKRSARRRAKRPAWAPTAKPCRRSRASLAGRERWCARPESRTRSSTRTRSSASTSTGRATSIAHSARRSLSSKSTPILRRARRTLRYCAAQNVAPGTNAGRSPTRRHASARLGRLSRPRSTNQRSACSCRAHVGRVRSGAPFSAPLRTPGCRCPTGRPPAPHQASVFFDAARQGASGRCALQQAVPGPLRVWKLWPRTVHRYQHGGRPEVRKRGVQFVDSLTV